jgi:outer membrane receptor for ferrienterochelin and colicins
VREENLDGSVMREQDIHTGIDARTRGLFMSPRLSYKFENSDTLTFQPFIGINRNDNSSDTFIDHLGGTRPAEYARLRTGSTSDSQDYVTARYLTAPTGYVATSAHTDPTLGLRFEMKL